MNKDFQLWCFGDAHVGTDLKRGRESLADAIRDSEELFEWDIAIDVGDMSGSQGLPDDDEGREVVRQFGTLKKHERERIYSVCGNHDRGGIHDIPAVWWQKWIDPFGEYIKSSGVDPTKRSFSVEGSWDRYSFRTGNLLFLMMSDINEPSQKIGRGDLGGNPSGVVSGETFQWWKRMVESNPDSIIVSAHHYMLKDTTVASGEWEGVVKDDNGNWHSGYHGYKERGTPQGSSYLYFVDSTPDAQAFEQYLADHPGAVDIWLGGHTHAHPDALNGNKSHIETKWGTHFINVAALTRYHSNSAFPNPPKSRLLTFTEGSNQLKIQCYMHTDEFKAKGWYDTAERILTLSHSFRI